jgi:hypothetical protein
MGGQHSGNGIMQDHGYGIRIHGKDMECVFSSFRHRTLPLGSLSSFKAPDDHVVPGLHFGLISRLIRITSFVPAHQKLSCITTVFAWGGGGLKY